MTMIREIRYQREQRMRKFASAEVVDTPGTEATLVAEQLAQWSEMKKQTQLRRQAGIEGEDSSDEFSDSSSDSCEFEPDEYEYMTYLVKATKPRDQILEVVNAFKIRFCEDRLFSRCLKCNWPLVVLGADCAHRDVHAKVAATYHQFFSCSNQECESSRDVFWGKDLPELGGAQSNTYLNAVEFATQFSYHG